MKKPLDKKCQWMVGVLLVGIMLTLAGCGGDSAGPPGARSGVGPPGAPVSAGGAGPPGLKVPRPGASPANTLPTTPSVQSPEKPAENGDANKSDPNNPFAPVTRVEQAGNIVSLASELIAAGVNPFLSRMPVPLDAAPTLPGEDSAQPAPAAPSVNVLDAVKLLGIVYSAKAPIALISTGSDANASQLVKPGDVIDLGGEKVKISRITQTSVDIQAMGQSKENRTFPIPDIIGFSADKSDSSNPGAPGTSSRASASASPQPTGTSGMDGPLDNLKKLTEDLLGGNSAKKRSPAPTSQKAPDVSLSEP